MRERRNYLLLMGAIAVALVGAVLLAVPGSPAYKKPTLGLDLQGGLEVVLRAVPDTGQQLTPQGMQTAQQIMTKRVDSLGVTSPNVAVQGGNEIVIQLAGVHDPAKAAQIIGTTGKLYMFDFETSLAAPTVNGGQPAPSPSLYSLLSSLQQEAKKGTPSAYYLFKAVSKKVTTKVKGKKVTKTTTYHAVLQGPAPNLHQLLLPYKNGKQPANTQILAVPAHRLAVSCTFSSGSCLGAGSNGTSQSGKYWYLFKYYPGRPNGPPQLTGNDLVESGISAQPDPNTGQPVVLLQFTSHGAHEFQRITKAEYDRGRQNAGLKGQLGNHDQTVINSLAGHNAIVLDGVLKSTPYIDYTNSQLQDGIVGGATIQTPTLKEAQNLAFVLKSGSLPYTFVPIERTDVSATLGKSSLHQAIWAAVAGLAIVALFLLLLYRFLGLVAVIGLAIYGLLYYAAILLFNVTLTLPGFAGLILTIGVAADANVVVFERIKEEVRAGRSVRAAISAGYGKGFHTILDANVVTVITAMVIFLIAVADVKGFALMLLIGTVISLLTAVAATRALLGLLSGFRWFDNPRFMGAHGQQTAKWLQIDFMRRRYVWFALSGVVILAGMVSLGVRGLNLGIDFKGGTQITFKTRQAYSTGSLQSFFAQQGQRGAVVQGAGKAVGGKFTDWQVRTEALKSADQSNLLQALKSNRSAYQTGVKNVSGTFGHQIAIDAIYGIVVSLLLITIYIAVRFDFKFAMPVILAMLHDIAVTVGVYALVGKEVSVATVAAVLTVLGYSIYDTIIIFDRIRENVPLMRRSPFATIANVSLWETIRRSLATTFITLLPIICLEILGGATLKDFAFALIVGVTSGAYSSIFFAAPLLTIWKEREPEYARRKRASEEGGSEPDGGLPARRRPWRPKGGPALDPGTLALQESEAALAAEATPRLVDAVTPEPATAQARREKRRQRRRSRPHGRAR
ncbi:MAG TPA: protein translocase subunit SecD [Gaiellaceae bacterium]|nr:protein translocase subunit SecD [Gaiellaceae bacterium]